MMTIRRADAMDVHRRPEGSLARLDGQLTTGLEVPEEPVVSIPALVLQLGAARAPLVDGRARDIDLVAGVDRGAGRWGDGARISRQACPARPPRGRP